MEIKAVSFDIGHTIIKTNNPLSWKSLYEPALRCVLEKCHLTSSDERIKQGIAVLSKYNTRENPRELEVTSDIIFSEIFTVWNESYDHLQLAKVTFYDFFQADTVCYDDAAEILNMLRAKGLKIGALTDVAYGMDNAFSLREIAPIRDYFDLILTSVDVGYRKPNTAGFIKLLHAFDVSPSQMIYVGDEEKDIVGANALGIISVLINRSGKQIDYGQTFTISNLMDLGGLL